MKAFCQTVFVLALMFWSFVLGFLAFPMVFVPWLDRYAPAGWYEKVMHDWYGDYLEWLYTQVFDKF